MAFPWLATVRPFTLTSSSQLRAEPPPHLGSGRYARDYNEVKALGRDVGSDRTPEQTAIAHFWNLNFGTQLSRALRELASEHVDDIGDSARLFALAHMAAADALISAFARSNSQLRTSGGYTRDRISGRNALRTALSNVSEVTGQRESVSLTTTQLRDGRLVYFIGVSPQNEATAYDDAFRRVLQSVELSDR